MKKTFLDFLASFGAFVVLIYEVVLSILKKPPSWSLLQTQLYRIGVTSLPVVAITGMSTGTVLAAQSFYQLASKGLASVTGIMVAKAMITELGPVLTSLMVTGRVGSAMCAELGTMKVTEQVDALRSMAVSPYHYLLAPRFIAGFLMVPLLTVFSVALGLLGGYGIASLLFGMSYASYFDPIPVHISPFDMTMGFVKSIFFGILLTTICCYKGIKTKGGAAGVGTATTQSVVISYVSILISDFLLTIALNSLHEEFITN